MPPDIIQHIRAKGIGIITEMVSHIRATDGKEVKVGQYSINPDSIKKAELSVSELNDESSLSEDGL